MSNQNLLKKISAKNLFGKIEAPEKAIELFALYGVANGTKTGKSQFGDWIAFTGDFEAANMETGESFRAPVCFLPQPAQGMLEAALMKNSDGVEFSFIVGIKPADNAFGYEYTVRPVKAANQSDALTALREMTQEAMLKTLPAPKAASTTPPPSKGKGK